MKTLAKPIEGIDMLIGETSSRIDIARRARNVTQLTYLQRVRLALRQFAKHLHEEDAATVAALTGVAPGVPFGGACGIDPDEDRGPR